MAENVKHIDEAKEKAKQAAEATGKAVQERLQTAREKFSEVADNLGQGAGSASTKVREKAGQASTVVKEKAGQVSTVARERYGVAAERAKEGYEKARKDLDHLTQDVNEYVRDNPGKSVLIAAGVGFLIGLVFRGRGRD
jgi:ElaB/YqjD/DUF883 family membrane-anchored ribosome-binding protein